MPVSQPWAGQIDGVAAASASCRSTSLRTLAQSAFEALQEVAKGAKGVFGRHERRREDVEIAVVCCWVRCEVPPAARAFTTAGNFDIARAWVGSSLDRALQLVDDPFERLNLSRQLTGRLAVIRVLHRQRIIRCTKLMEFRFAAPSGAKTDEDRQTSDGAQRNADHPEADRHAAHKAGSTIRDHNRVAT